MCKSAEGEKHQSYSRLAQGAFLEIATGKVPRGEAITLELIKHTNPSTGESCLGTLVSEYSSWEEALGSWSMVEGGVTTVCSKCGAVEFVNSSREVI